MKDYRCRRPLRTNTVIVLFALIFSIAASGCSSKAAAPVVERELVALPAAPREASIPYELKVVEELNDGKRLLVVGTISGKVAWDPSKVVVRLAGLRDGVVKEENFYTLSRRGAHAAGESLQKGVVVASGEPVSFSLSIPAGQISDYQLEVLWGQEALAYQKLPAPANQKSSALEVREVSFLPKPCSTAGCVPEYRVEGQLVNTGTVPIAAATLGLGFRVRRPGAQLDLSGLIPENEEQITLPKLNLAPGKSRPIRFVLDRGVPGDGREFQPVLRVIEARAK